AAERPRIGTLRDNRVGRTRRISLLPCPVSGAYAIQPTVSHAPLTRQIFSTGYHRFHGSIQPRGLGVAHARILSARVNKWFGVGTMRANDETRGPRGHHPIGLVLLPVVLRPLPRRVIGRR